MARYKSKPKTAGYNFSQAGLEAVKNNLEVQRKHGAFEFLRKNVAPVPNCSQCIFASECEYYKKEQTQCRAILGLQNEIYEEISELSYIRHEDLYLVERFVKNFCFLLIVEKWLASVGPFQVKKEGLDVQPILSVKVSYERLVLKEAEALGIGPQARARLNLTNVQSFCFAEALQKAKPINEGTARIIVDEQEDEDSTDNN